jgi:hypothetical protein
MAGLVAAIAILMIFSLVTFQAWDDVDRRDDEAEMMFRAQDLVRAIQRYRRDHGGVAPTKLEELMEPGPRGQYYLRRLWKDPLVRDGKWGLLYLGPSGEILDPNAETPPDGGEAQAPVGIGGLANPPGGGSLQQMGQPQGAVPGEMGLQSIQQRSATGTESEVAGGRQMSGVPIAGVRTLSDGEPFRVYRDLTEYSEWHFTFLDLEAQAGQGPQAGQPPTGVPAGDQGPGLVPTGGGPGRRPVGSRPFGSGSGRRPPNRPSNPGQRLD